MVNPILRKGTEEARDQLPDILDAAERGLSTIITRHGRPVAALVPIGEYGAALRQQPLMPVAGSGRGIWGKNSARALRKQCDEWSR
jgi:prevent-host-death family protein